MNHRPLRLLFCLLILATAHAGAQENRYYSFGPETGPLFVITTPEQQDRRMVLEIEKLARELSIVPPSFRILLAITEKDFSRLPESLRKTPPEGTAQLISRLSAEEAASVLVILPGSATLLRNGFRGSTPPRWFLESAIRTLESAQTAWKLEESRLPLYRVGWIPENPLAGAYQRANIPTLCIEADSGIGNTLLEIAQACNIARRDQNDRHYLLEGIRGRYYFMGENILVVFMILAFSIILATIFIFSFLFGKKREQRMKDLFRLWWLPFFYLSVTILGLLGGQTLSLFLFRFRFGTPEGWSLLPGLALGAKFIFSWFIITLIISFNQVIRLPDDSFVYGYIASICSIISIFVFSGFDFSLSLLFLLTCLITIVAHRFNHPVLQCIAIACMFLPFIPYLTVLVYSDAQTIAPLFLGEGYWNPRMAFFVMPFQLMFAKFFHTVGAFGRRQRFYLPVNTLYTFIAAMAMAFLTLFYPAWSPAAPRTLTVYHTITGDGERFATDIPSLLPLLDLERGQTPTLSRDPEDLIRVEDSSVRFLDKRLVSMTITPAVPVERIRVSVSSIRGISVYSASIPFEFRGSGNEAIFVSNDYPFLPLTFSFSSDHDSALTATVTLWTTDNPWGVRARNGSFSADYLLEVTRTVALASMSGEPRRGDTR